VNPFEQLAEQQMVAATKAKHRAREKREAKVVQSEKDAPMKLSEMEQQQADQSKQFRLYKQHKRAERMVVFERRAAEWSALSKVLRALTIDNVDTLIDFVAGSAWLHEADHNTRQVVLGVISNELIRVRRENGYAPMDDSLPGEDPTAFEIIRTMLKVQT